MNFIFTSIKKSADILNQTDDYLRNISPETLQLLNIPNLTHYSDLINMSIQTWTNAEINRYTVHINELNKQLNLLGINTDEDVYLIKSSGFESMGMPYSRHNAIVFTPAALNNQLPIDTGLGLLSHELFHIISRRKKENQHAIYSLHNFNYNPVTVNERTITNPDAPNNNYSVNVNYNGKLQEAIPALFFSLNNNQPQMKEKFLLIGNKLVHLNDTNYLDVVKPNSEWSMYHPEEISAEDFRLIIEGVSIPTKQDLIKLLK